MKSILLALLLVVGACSSNPSNKPHADGQDIIVPDQGPVVSPETQDAAIEALKPIATVIEFINHTEKEKTRNTNALNKIRETARGECFKNGMLTRKLIQTNGKTNLEVVNDLMNADVKIKLTMYRSSKKVSGWTKPSSDTINLNRKYHDNWDPCDVGSNLFHEISHKIKYGHDYYANYQRQFSVPYSIGTIMDQCCKEN